MSNEKRRKLKQGDGISKTTKDKFLGTSLYDQLFRLHPKLEQIFDELPDERQRKLLGIHAEYREAWWLAKDSKRAAAGMLLTEIKLLPWEEFFKGISRLLNRRVDEFDCYGNCRNYTKLEGLIAHGRYLSGMDTLEKTAKELEEIKLRKIREFQNQGSVELIHDVTETIRRISKLDGIDMMEAADKYAKETVKIKN